MPSNYDSNSGLPWVRSNRVVIDNVYGVTPLIHFMREKIVKDGADIYKKDMEAIWESMTDPMVEFPQRNPETGIETGVTYTYQDAYVLLHSLFIYLDIKKEAEIISASDTVSSTTACDSPGQTIGVP